MIVPLISALIKFWPFGNTEKEKFFIYELQEILVKTQDILILKPLIVKIFKRVSKCILGLNMTINI